MTLTFLLKKYNFHRINDFSIGHLRDNRGVSLAITGGIKDTKQFIKFNIGFISMAIGKATSFILPATSVKSIKSMLSFLMFSMLHGWYLKYSVVGYNFSFRNNTFRRLLRLNLGFSRHKLVVQVPRSISIHQKRRRNLIIFSNNYIYIYILATFIHNARNILPYKLRGMVLENSCLSILKQGKKVKFR